MASDDKIILMLGELKGAVEKGFEDVNRRMDDGTKRMDGHEIRLRITELWQATATGKVALIGTVFSIVAALIGNFLIKAFIQPQ